jgi:hypothetical membrane protein
VSFSDVLVSIHFIAAQSLSIPELAINGPQGEALAKAISDVGGETMSGMDPRVMAWINLSMVCMGIYGKAFVSYKDRAKREKSGKVVSITGNGTNG